MGGSEKGLFEARGVRVTTEGIQDTSAGSLQRLIDVGIALSAEQDTDRLLERILLEAKDLTKADGGTVYLLEDGALRFAILRTASLGMALGGTTGRPISLPNVPLVNPSTGEPNHSNVASHAALSARSVNIADAYLADEFDFSGTRTFDEQMGYRSTSFLTVPMLDHNQEVIGVLQLINAKDPASGETIPFCTETQRLVEALASQAAVALDNRFLAEEQRELFEALTQLIATAIDAKSPYAGRHCNRVPALTGMLADAAVRSSTGPYADFELSADERYALHVGSWLHDCGKLVSPEYVVDKATKLETIYNRIHEVRMRFEVLKRDATIRCLEGICAGGDETELRASLAREHAALDEAFEFVASCNTGGERLSDECVDRLREIGAMEWTRTLDDTVGISRDDADRRARYPAQPLPCRERVLADRPWDRVEWGSPEQFDERNRRFGFQLTRPDFHYNRGELYNLSVSRGTLTAEERFVINDHIAQTIVMLEQLPFPANLRRVPEFAGAHHERMDGNGFPRKLTADEMSIPSRMVAIADIFEALTASDRPYKTAMPLSMSVAIMSDMAQSGHIDPDLFRLFLTSGIHLEYAKRFLSADQIDEVDIDQYLRAPQGS